MIGGWFKYFYKPLEFMDLFTCYGGGKGGGSSAPSADPNIGLAQQRMAQISEDYYNQFKDEIWPEMQRQAQQQEARADEQFQFDREVQDKQKAIADEQYDRYLNTYKPLQDDLINEAKEYDTEANRERLAEEAIGDTKNAFAVKAADEERRQQSYGINPTSGQALGARNANSVLEAATSASAATRTRSAAEQLGWAKKVDALGFGSGVFGNQATSTGLSLNAGNQALAAGQTGFNNTGALAGQASGAAGQANAGWGAVGNLGVQKYNADVNAYSAGKQAEAGASAGWGSAIGGIAGGLGAYF